MLVMSCIDHYPVLTTISEPIMLVIFMLVVSCIDLKRTYQAMRWSKIEVEDGVLTLWPGTPVREADLYGPESIHDFFKKSFDIEVTPVGCVTTLPDVDGAGENIEGTGGRQDFFFFVKVSDVPKFAIKRLQFGMRWWSDVYFNGGEDIYPPEFLSAYPDTVT